MTFIPARATPGFQAGTRLLDTELNLLQNQLVQAVDGYMGGTYPLQHSLVIGGMSLNANVGAGALDAHFGGLLTSTTGLQSTGGLSVLGNSFITGGSLTVSGGDLTVSGTVQSASSSTSNFGGTVVAPTFSSTNDSFIGGALHATNGVLPRITIGLDTSGTHLYSPNNYDLIIAPSIISADRTYQIDDTGLGSTNRIIEFVNNTAFLVHILNPSAVELGGSPIHNGTGNIFSVRYWRSTAGVWNILDYRLGV